MPDPADPNNPVPGGHDPSAPREFRMPRMYGAVWGGALIFFGTFGTSSVWEAATNADGSFPRPFEFAVVFGLFSSFWIVLSLWGLMDWKQHRLVVGDETLRYIGVIRDVQFSRDDLVEVRWRGFYRRGSVVIRSSRSRLSLDLDGYSDDERDDLIDRLRALARDASQQGWEAFNQPRPELSPEERRRVAIQGGSICCGLLLVTSLVFAAAGAWGLGWHWYAVSVALAVWALSYPVRMRTVVSSPGIQWIQSARR